MLKLEDIIDAKEGREIKRALAAKMVLEGFETYVICKLLEVSASFVSKWKNVYEAEGAEGLLLNHKGSKSFLTSGQRNEVIAYLKDLSHFSVEELRDYIESIHGVVYKSKQSYYDLFDEAGISWHKSQKVNPKRDEEKIFAKREDIKKKLKEHESEIKSGELFVFIEDECHLLWGDTLGYIWGKKNERIELPITNERTRQTYYGAIDIHTREFVLSEFDKANGDHTVAFVKQLQELRDGKKILLIWDQASYHRYSDMKKYLEEVNKGLEEKDWKVTCLLFESNAPEQNPVEDIWLKGKNFLRSHFYQNKTFQQVKNSFFDFLNQQIFDFNKLGWYW